MSSRPPRRSAAWATWSVRACSTSRSWRRRCRRRPASSCWPCSAPAPSPWSSTRSPSCCARSRSPACPCCCCSRSPRRSCRAAWAPCRSSSAPPAGSGLLLADSSDRVARWGTPLRATARYGGDASLGRVGRRIGAAALGVAVVVPPSSRGWTAGCSAGRGDGDGGGGSRTTTTYNPILSLAGAAQPADAASAAHLHDRRRRRTTCGSRRSTCSTSGRGWSSSELSGDIDDDRVRDGVEPPVGRTALVDPVRVEVDLAGNLDGPWLPVPATPDDVDIDGPWLWDAEAETVFSTRTSVRDVDDPYVVRRLSGAAHRRRARRAQSAVPAEITETYAVTPELTPYVGAGARPGHRRASRRPTTRSPRCRRTSATRHVFTYSDQAPALRARTPSTRSRTSCAAHRLLRAVRLGHGGAGARAGAAGPRGRRLHDRSAGRRRLLPRHHERGARLARGLVPGLGLGAVRADAAHQTR